MSCSKSDNYGASLRSINTLQNFTIHNVLCKVHVIITIFFPSISVFNTTMMASLDDFVLQLNDRLSDAKKENSLPCCLIDRPVDQVSNGRADDFFTEAQKQQPNDPTDFNNLDRPANNKDALNHDARLFTQDDCMHTSTSLNLQSTSTLERTDGNVAVDNTIGGNSCK